MVFFSTTKQRYVKVAGRFGCKTASEGVFEEKTLSISGNYTNALGGDDCYALKDSYAIWVVIRTAKSSSTYSGIFF